MAEKVRDITFNRVKWARQHDWYITSIATGENANGDAVYEVMAVDTTDGSRKWFYNYAELRLWAGY